MKEKDTRFWICFLIKGIITLKLNPLYLKFNGRDIKTEWGRQTREGSMDTPIKKKYKYI